MQDLGLMQGFGFTATYWALQHQDSLSNFESSARLSEIAAL